MFMKRWMEAIIQNGHQKKKLVQDKHQRPCLDILGHDILGRGNLVNLNAKLQTISMKQLSSKKRNTKAGKGAQNDKKKISLKFPSLQ